MRLATCACAQLADRPAALQKTNTPGRRKTFDSVLSPMTEMLMLAMYEEATRLGGAVNLSKLRKVGELRAFKSPSDPLGHRLLGSDLHNHHTVPEQWAKKLLVGKSGMPATANDPAWDAILDDMPGLLIDKHYHIPTAEGIDAGIESFHGVHGVLRNLLPDGKPAEASEIFVQLEQAYENWDPELGPHVWRAAEAWLESKGVVAP